MTETPNCLEVLPLNTWLHIFHQLSAAQSVLLLGAGTPASPLIQWLQEIPEIQVTLIEGDTRQFERLASLVPSSWELKSDIVAAQADKTKFYLASNPTESSLEATETLQSLWPQLSTLETIRCHPEALNRLLEIKPNWLLIDFLAPSTLLESVQNALHSVNFLLIRASTHKDLPSTLQAQPLEATIKELGFQIVHRHTERHPSVEQWFCIRQQDNFKINELADELKEKNIYIGMLEKKNEENEARNQAKAELEKNLKNANAARFEQEKLATARQQRIDELESQVAEMQTRQTLVNDEIAKAEGQIELIKDVLLREQGI